MYLKILYQILKFILNLLCTFVKMVSKTGKSTPSCYMFRTFKFEKVVPNESGREPFPRSGHRISADSANFYCFGGYNPVVPPADAEEDTNHNSYPLFQELWRFNFASKKWYLYPNRLSLPTELASNALLLRGNFLMVYGGTGSPFGFQCSNQLYLCKINDEEGTTVKVYATGQLPLPLYGQAVIYHNDHLYTIGGTTGLSYTCDIHRLNIKTKSWEVVYIGNGQGDYEPEGRYRHEVAFDGKNIYILGGGTAEIAYGFSHIPVFNLQKKVWHEKKALEDPVYGHPQPRLCHGAVQIQTESGIQVFITGGHDGVNLFNDLWKLDLNTLQWTIIDTCRLPRPMYFLAATVSPEGRMYVFGGIYRNSRDEAVRCNNLYSTWLCIPKLSEISWEAMLFYFPQITECDRQKLIDAGLPRHFIQRLENSKVVY